MSTSNRFAPEIVTEGKLDAPFGKRLYDEAVLLRRKGVAQFKFWGSWLFLITLTLLAVIQASDRVARLTPKPIAFETPVREATTQGDKVTVPTLVLTLQRPAAPSPWTKVKLNPIQVLSFVGAKKIPPGAEAKAALLTGATNGLIKARLIEPLKIDGDSILDAGTLLMGQGRSTEERLFVQFQKAVFRDGKYIGISAQAYDVSDSIVGLKGSRVGDMGLKLAASSGLHFLAGMATGLQAPTTDENGKPRRPDTRDAALNGVSQAASEQARGYMEEIKQQAPLIEVKAGTVFIVTFDGGDE